RRSIRASTSVARESTVGRLWRRRVEWIVFSVNSRKRENRMLARLAHLVIRRRLPVIGVWLVLTVVGGFAAGKLSSRWYQTFSVPGMPAYEAGVRTLDAFGVGVRPPNVVVFHTHGDATRSAAIERATARAAATMPGARSTSYYSTHDLMYVSS